MNLLDELTTPLQQDPRLSVGGQLLKNQITELALKLDAGLLRLLLSHPHLKEHFFTDVDGVLVFDKEKFTRFVNNKAFLPDSYTSFKNKIGLMTEDGRYLSESRDVVLAWPYKDCVLEGGQTKEDQKRDEIFWNTILAPDEIDRLFEPKVLTNWKRYDAEGEHQVTEIRETDNLIIKGNNLLALHSLKKRFASKVKLIYIDPPYNTPGDANTFGYNNSFNHSTWLTFMENRIVIARDLLRDDGVLAIAIDDEEQAYLKVLCDGIFGRENFIGTLVVQSKPSGRTNDAYLATCHEYVLFYAKKAGVPKINFFELPNEQKSLYKEGEGENAHKWRDFLRTGGYSTPEERPNSYYPIYFNRHNNDISLERKGPNYVEILPIDSSGKKRVWRKTPKSFLEHLEKGEIKISKTRKGGWKVQIIDRIKPGIRPKSVWVESKYDASSHGTKLLKNLFGGERVFSFPKSIYAVQDVIDLFTERGGNDIVLDFFAGSGTTAHATLNLNKKDGGIRQFILCEQLDYVETVTAERVRNVIVQNGSGDSFIYCELMQWNQRFVERIQVAEDRESLQAIWEEMQEKAHLSYRLDIRNFGEHATEFADLSLEEQKRFLLETMDANQLYVNLSEMDDETYGVSEADKRLNRQFYDLG